MGASWLRPDGAVGRPREEGGRDLIPPLARGSTPCRTSPSPVQPSTSISQWQPIELPQSCNTSRRGQEEQDVVAFDRPESRKSCAKMWIQYDEVFTEVVEGNKSHDGSRKHWKLQELL
ncbi:hypothetical protein BS78_K104800 [Paspalum vaginatum]|uniref:Uncharacterized protein n=1 Tax=Paspalum vaginatum TaxID=158149 RepID=A0A9W8CGW8_9POAL|nr:hypothetical protein BS78_K030000 [Paspalum vaginatum]KAJ1257307.1 hypothetical protein BS78_K104800 [Paspalum vaginatum]